MRRWLPWAAAAVAVAIAAHAAVLYALPRAIMRVAMDRLAVDGVNTAFFPPRADAGSRAVVRPSPDLLYSVCVFDVSEGPLRIRGKVPRATYWSISMFAANTDNFFKLNDREMKTRRFDLVLALPGQAAPRPRGARLIEAPSARGIILGRTLVGDEAFLGELDRSRRLFVCEPLANARLPVPSPAEKE